MLRTIAILSALVCALAAAAQTAISSPERHNVAAVSDRRTTEGQSVAGSDTTALDTLPQPRQQYMPLFAPLTFHRDIARRHLALDADTADAVRPALLHAYIQAPQHTARPYTGQSRQTDVEAPQQKALTEQITDNESHRATLDTPAETLDLFIARPHFWQFNGDYALQFMQNHVSDNWHKGGSDNYAMLASATLQYNYNNKQRVKWDNRLELRLGFQTSQADTLHTFKTTDDLLRYTTKVGFQAHKQWYYTAQLIASTQFMRGFKDNDDRVYSDFLSPLNVNVSIGMDYAVDALAHTLKGNVHLAPIAYNLKYVDRLALATRFGIDEGHHALHDYGSQITADAKWQPLEFLTWQARLYAYTTYEKFEFEFENTITFRFNRYISTNLYLYPRFDDSARREPDATYWQFKEYLSVGFAYSM